MFEVENRDIILRECTSNFRKEFTGGNDRTPRRYADHSRDHSFIFHEGLTLRLTIQW